METTQICTKCDTEKPISEFAFRTDIQRYRKQCKECRRIQVRENYNKQKDNEDFVIKKRGYAKKYYPRYTERVKAYQEKNKDKLIEYRKEYRAKNYSEIRRKEKEYNIKNKQVRKEYAEKNKDKIKANKREYYLNNKNLFRERWREYRKTEKGKMVYKNSNSKRRAKLREGNIKTEELQLLIESSKACYWCNKKLNKGSKKDYHIDHYIPLAKGGLHTLENLVISCSFCNLSKGTKDPLEFALSKGKLL